MRRVPEKNRVGRGRTGLDGQVWFGGGAAEVRMMMMMMILEGTEHYQRVSVVMVFLPFVMTLGSV